MGSRRLITSRGGRFIGLIPSGMPDPRALVIRAAGTNCDAEMVRGFEMGGAAVSLVHVDRLIADPALVGGFDLIGFPGGFSYGDDIASGRILAMKLRARLYPALREAARRGCPMIGVCNGFQAIVQVGLLPGPASGSDWPEDRAPEQTVSLAHNAGGRFIDKWVRVEADAGSPCIWTRPWAEWAAEHPGEADDVLRLPIAHGEGRFVAASEEVVAGLRERGQIALRYAAGDNPNGSMGDVAGLCDASGRIFGLMPHPDRYLGWTLHPFWTRLEAEVRDPRRPTPGAMMFRAAVEAAQATRV